MKATLFSRVDRLVKGLKPGTWKRIPKGFQFWSTKMQIMWLKQNQKPPKRKPHAS